MNRCRLITARVRRLVLPTVMWNGLERTDSHRSSHRLRPGLRRHNNKRRYSSEFDFKGIENIHTKNLEIPFIARRDNKSMNAGSGGDHGVLGKLLGFGVQKSGPLTKA